MTAAAQIARRALRRFVRDHKATRAAVVVGALIASLAFAGCANPAGGGSAFVGPVPTPTPAPSATPCAAPFYEVIGGQLFTECAS